MHAGDLLGHTAVACIHRMAVFYAALGKQLGNLVLVTFVLPPAGESQCIKHMQLPSHNATVLNPALTALLSEDNKPYLDRVQSLPRWGVTPASQLLVHFLQELIPIREPGPRTDPSANEDRQLTCPEQNQVPHT